MTETTFNLNIDIMRETSHCRACLQFMPQAINVGMSLLDTEVIEHDNEKFSFLQCYNICTQLNLEAEDLKDNYALCQQCRNQLFAAFEFRCKARASHKRLLQVSKEKQSAAVAEQEEEMTVDVEAIANFIDDTADEWLEKAAAELLEKIETDWNDTNLQDSFISDDSAVLQLDLCEPTLNIMHESNDPVTSFDELSSYIEKLEAEESANELAVNFMELHNASDISNNNLQWENVAKESTENSVNAASTDLEDANSSIGIETETAPSNDEKSSLLDFSFKCQICAKVFHLQRFLLRHQEDQHDLSNLNCKCEQCGKFFINKRVLRAHTQEIHNKQAYVDCLQCGSYVMKSFLKVHKKRHLEASSFICNVCSRSFKSKSSLQQHTLLHSATRERDFVCTECEKTFYTANHLQIHKRRTHKAASERFKCDLCEKSFQRASNLKMHMQLHCDNATPCEYCGKQFVRLCDLEVHLRFHAGDLPHKCNLCDKRFGIKAHLKEHLLQHDGARYKCNECDKDFVNLTSLRSHRLGHIGMPFICKCCGGGFPTKFKIQRHLRHVHHSLFMQSGYTDDLADVYITKCNIRKPKTKLNEVQIVTSPKMLPALEAEQLLEA